VKKEYVGIDLHRRRSVIVRKDSSGKALETVQIDNDPLALALAEVVGRAGGQSTRARRVCLSLLPVLDGRAPPLQHGP
jgi:hypothetical protein